jgi:hypothetical protein
MIHTKFTLRMVRVRLRLHPLLGTQQVLLQHDREILTMAKPFCQVSNDEHPKVEGTWCCTRIQQVEATRTIW